jgi:hypothetical protein
VQQGRVGNGRLGRNRPRDCFDAGPSYYSSRGCGIFGSEGRVDRGNQFRFARDLEHGRRRPARCGETGRTSRGFQRLCVRHREARRYDEGQAKCEARTFANHESIVHRKLNRKSPLRRSGRLWLAGHCGQDASRKLDLGTNPPSSRPSRAISMGNSNKGSKTPSRQLDTPAVDGLERELSPPFLDIIYTYQNNGSFCWTRINGVSMLWRGVAATGNRQRRR